MDKGQYEIKHSRKWLYINQMKISYTVPRLYFNNLRNCVTNHLKNVPRVDKSFVLYIKLDIVYTGPTCNVNKSTAYMEEIKGIDGDISSFFT